MQLVGRRGNDARLLRTARWLVKTLGRERAGGRRRPGSAPPQEGTIAMMTTLITGVIGIAMLAAFLGFMLWWVKALPLIIIVVGRDGAADLRFRAHAAPRRRRSRALSCPNRCTIVGRRAPTCVMKIVPPARCETSAAEL